ncbi:hypothetical protein LXO72_09960 [Streptococcus sp. XMC]|uniref:hypothetical protein n=1 Tax=Streptococcus TaxID=1301 RepID=UPI0007770E28|nr:MULTISPECIES: hypothetical protein [Streptococcus]KXT87135.1 hypothetical protein SPADD19_01347 [Streptococcus parasanguinis]MCE3592683.1 hypothetical protein [Streptococcus sp. XMC]
MKFSKKMVFIAMLVGVLLLTPYLGYKYYVNKYVKPYTIFLFKRKIVDYKYIEDGKALVIKWDYDNPLDYWLASQSTYVYWVGPVASQNKIVQEYKRLPIYRNEPTEGEYWKIAVYDIKTKGFPSKDYDVFKMTRDYDSNDIPVGIASTIYISEGRELLDIHLKNAKDGSLFTKSIDLNEGKIVELGKGRDYEQYATATSFYNLLPDSKDYYMFNWEFGVSKDGKLAKDALIRQKYPEAAKLLEDNNGSIVVLADKPSIENNMPIYQLLYKEGTNLFENVKIPAENSVDGQEHIVNSQEEFIKYYRNKEVGEVKSRM